MRNSSKNKSKKQKQTEYVQKEKEKKKKIFKSLGRYHNKLPRNNRMPKTLNQQSKKKCFDINKISEKEHKISRRKKEEGGKCFTIKQNGQSIIIKSIENK